MPFFSRGAEAASMASASAPPSPTMSAHTTRTNVGLSSAKLPEQLINRADLRNSISAYETLLTASKAYTQALISLGLASSQLATAFETCSRLKGAHKVGSGLLAASGVHHMSSNSWSILADTFWKETSIPLMEHHDLYVTACAERSLQHEKSITEKARALNQAEKRNQRESRSKVGRDLHSFRRALNELQRHVDDLDEEKARYYADVLEGEEECWSFVQEKAIASLRNQLDMFERISNKGLSDPILEPLLSRIEDPFSAYGPPRNDDQIYSILHHGTLLGLTPTADLSRGSDTPAADTTAEAITTADTSAGTSNADNLPPMMPSNLIMSPSTPSKGLSRVTSGAASPKLSSEAVTASGSKTPSNGLGISLAAAVELARNSVSSSPPQLKDAAQGENKAQRQRDLLVEQNAELFGTDGEDDGGDEASIFSGTEDDLESSVTGTLQGDGKAGRSNGVGMAAKIMQEKKRRRENAVRANAKTRLKNALSTIDESKAPFASLVVIEDNHEGDKTITKDESKTDTPLAEKDVNSGNTDVNAESGKVGKKTQQDSQIQSQEHDVDSVW